MPLILSMVWGIAGRKMTSKSVFRLRSKLLLVSLALLAIPWAGYEYVREMETFLRESKQVSLADNARAVATVMHNRRNLFEPRADIRKSINKRSSIYARKLSRAIQLDGYSDDWAEHLPHAKTHARQSLIQGNTPYSEQSLSFRHLLGRYGKYFYTIFEIKDDSVVYRSPNSLRLEQSDHLLIAMRNQQGKLNRYILTTQAPGWVNAYLLSDDSSRIQPVRPEVRIKGEWQETDTGYNLELRIPQSMLNDKIAFAIVDVDDPVSRETKHILSTSGGKPVTELGTILTLSPEIENILQGLDKGNSRIWVINRNRHVLALSGSLTQHSVPDTYPDDDSTLSKIMRSLYRLILQQPNEQFDDTLDGVSRLEGVDIVAALEGKPSLRWRRTPDKRAVILSASHPVWDDDTVIGAVVVEQTSNDIQTLQNNALESLLNMTLLVFISAMAFLLMFATRLSGRIRSLHKQAESAISEDGRIQGIIKPSAAGDEIGDLSRSFSDMLDRLREYTRYLETMASKLSHELRTPLAVVRSSLDNLELEELPDTAQPYTQRAREGIERLANILNSMNEATRLEQALQSTESEHFDLDALLSGCIEGYRLAYPEQTFTYSASEGELFIEGYPERLAQMLDKLISNAVDFCKPDTAINISLNNSDKAAFISVENKGPTLPESMQGQLFDSMVSMREGSSSHTHLGLGLFIARLIAQFHRGTVTARNLGDEQGVVFTVELPL